MQVKQTVNTSGADAIANEDWTENLAKLGRTRNRTAQRYYPELPLIPALKRCD